MNKGTMFLRECIKDCIRSEIELHVAEKENPESLNLAQKSNVDTAYDDLDKALEALEFKS
jgi:hypothetical protein